MRAIKEGASAAEALHGGTGRAFVANPKAWRRRLSWAGWFLLKTP